MENSVKPKSRRGRKPKIKENTITTTQHDQQPEMIVKKKRGRKKKCEMNLENIPKISGYNPNGESIDTQDNKVKFGADTVSDASDECENLSFGILNIKRHNVVRKKPTQSENNQICEIQNNGCLINFDWIVDNIKQTATQENPDKPQGKTPNEQSGGNLSNFFDVKPQEKIINYTKNSHQQSAKDTVNRNKNKMFGRSTKYINILHRYKGKDTPIPKKTDVWCWWCCHQFDGIPRFMPTNYDEVRKRFRVMGIFCSWSCVKAFYENEPKYSNGSKGTLLTTLIRTIHGRYYDISSAPPRSALKVFGGTMTIEQFRNIDKNIYYEINSDRITMDRSYYLREVISE